MYNIMNFNAFVKDLSFVIFSSLFLKQWLFIKANFKKVFTFEIHNVPSFLNFLKSKVSYKGFLWLILARC
ncbi:hypothetical protein DMC01_07060 [Campylobacter troglodytis]|nr:hypothetical protein DMC01_07060 [Campylobacter troglodytis]